MNDKNDNTPSSKDAILDELESIKGLLDDSFDDDDELSIDIPILDDVVQHDDNASSESLLDLDQIFEEESITETLSSAVNTEPSTSTINDEIVDFSDDTFTELELDNLEFENVDDIEIPSFKLEPQTDGVEIENADSIESTNTTTNTSPSDAHDPHLRHADHHAQSDSGEPESLPIDEDQEDLFADEEPQDATANTAPSQDSNDDEPNLEFIIQDIVDEMIPHIEDELRQRLSSYSSETIKALAKKHLEH